MNSVILGGLKMGSILEETLDRGSLLGQDPGFGPFNRQLVCFWLQKWVLGWGIYTLFGPILGPKTPFPQVQAVRKAGRPDPTSDLPFIPLFWGPFGTVQMHRY